MGKKEIDDLIHKLYLDNKKKLTISDNGNVPDFSEKILSELFNEFSYSVDCFNKKAGNRSIDIFDVPKEIIEIIFNSKIEERGFILLFNKLKLVLVLFESENFISFSGKILYGKSNKSLIKLLRLSYEGENYTDLKFKDNSGSNVDKNNLIFQILNWGLN